MKEGVFIKNIILTLSIFLTFYLVLPNHPTINTYNEYANQTDVSFCFDDKETSIPSNSVYCHVIHVINGNTFVGDINGNEEYICLIGIDTPKNVNQKSSKNTLAGELASAYLKDLLEEKDVFLEFDIQERDKYQRLLAYVYLDGIMVNQYLLQKGYATLDTQPPNIKYLDSFQEIQNIFLKEHLPSPYEINNLTK